MSADVWASYWSGREGPSGCLPNAEARYAPVLRKVWQQFGRALKPGSRVLDLATGDGAVLRTLQGAGRKLDLTGIDSAPALPSAPRGIRLKPGVRMEALPFGDEKVDALTSQFGVEYGEIASIAAEAGRVLAPRGTFRFVLHHADGPIVHHNRARREALAWSAFESGVLDRARRLAGARAAAAIPTPQSFHAAVDEAARRFEGQTAAAEFHAAVARTLDLGARHPPAETLEVLQELETRAHQEVGRIDALLAAACDDERMAQIAEALDGAGVQVMERGAIRDQVGQAFAWLVDGGKA